MTLTSVYQAVVPTSAHNVGLIVDPGAELIREIILWAEVSFLYLFLDLPQQSMCWSHISPTILSLHRSNVLLIFASLPPSLTSPTSSRDTIDQD
jgi:hypothetical protein